MHQISIPQRALEPKYDVVFLDPPYKSGVLPDVMMPLTALLNAGARVYVESAEPFARPGFNAIREGHAGQVYFQLLQAAE